MKRGGPLRRTGSLRRGEPLRSSKTLASSALSTRKNRQRGREAELQISLLYEQVTGRPLRLQPGSGNQWHRPGDGISSKHLVESKSFNGSSATVSLSTLKDHWALAARLGRLPLAVYVFDGNLWAVTDAHDIAFSHRITGGATQATIHTAKLLSWHLEANEKDRTFAAQLSFQGDSATYALMALEDYLRLEGEQQ